MHEYYGLSNSATNFETFSSTEFNTKLSDFLKTPNGGGFFNSLNISSTNGTLMASRFTATQVSLDTNEEQVAAMNHMRSIAYPEASGVPLVCMYVCRKKLKIEKKMNSIGTRLNKSKNIFTP